MIVGAHGGVGASGRQGGVFEDGVGQLIAEPLLGHVEALGEDHTFPLAAWGGASSAAAAP